MSEIEKMYENCNIKKIRYCEVEDECPFMFGHRCEDCDLKPKPEYYIYPPFTAEKQLELIKWLARKDYGDYTSSISITITDDRCYFSAGEKPKYFANEVLYDSNRFTDFEQSLSNLINQLWQDLTEEERKQIKEILE